MNEYIFYIPSKFRKAVMIITLAVSPTLFAQNTFVSKQGYKLEYPKCWKVIIDSPDVDQKIEESKDISVSPSPNKCLVTDKDLISFSGISIATWVNLKNIADIENEIKKKENWLKKNHWPNYGYKRINIGDAHGITFIEEVSEKRARWNTFLYCPSLKVINISGPSKSPKHKDYERTLARIKAGNLDYPMPEKAIIDSIKCTTVK